jgi:dUTP pyrophosphatase
MTRQVCIECGPGWNGMYNTDHRCLTCGAPTHTVPDRVKSPLKSPLKIARVGTHNLAAPKPESVGAAALDIRTNEDITLYPGEERLVGTGYAYEPPPGYALLLLPRSGLGAKHGIVLGNTIGLIDPDYRGELKAALWYRRNEGKAFAVARGERIAQLVCVPVWSLSDIAYVDYEDLSETARGEGGFGHTGKQ